MKITHLVAYEGKVAVSLAQMQEAYVPLFVPWINKRDGIEGTLQRPPYSLEMGREWVRSLDKQKGEHEVFAVLMREGRNRSYRYIGHTGLHRIQPYSHASTGSVIVDPRGRSKGCGTEAKLLLLHHAFHVLGLRDVRSTVKAWNAQSLGHLLKCGYQIRGRFKQAVFHNGEYVDEILLQVRLEEFLPIWDAYQKTHMLPALSDTQRALVQEQTSL
jgi:RimJ/RimL family protein N-acetyltransferase